MILQADGHTEMYLKQSLQAEQTGWKCIKTMLCRLPSHPISRVLTFIYNSNSSLG